MIKKVLPFFVLSLSLLSWTLFSQNLKTISGKVSKDSKAIANVHVKNTTSKIAVKSNAEGKYSIEAKVGDEISFSFVGLKTITISVEDVTSILNIEMTEETNLLDNVVVKAKVKKKETTLTLEAEDITISPPGLGTVINLKTSPRRIIRFNVDRLNKALGYAEALGGYGDQVPTKYDFRCFVVGIFQWW